MTAGSDSLPVASRELSSREWRQFWLLLLFALIVLGAGIGLRDPWPADEPRFALVAKQMVESGDWLFPHRGSTLYPDKPPLFMALQALSFEITRNWRIAFLLPSLLAALGTLTLVYDLARRLWDHRTGLVAAGTLLATVQFLDQSKSAQIDPCVMFFVALANYGLLRHFLLGPNWRAYWLGCFAAGLGVITKGVGVLALLMFVPYLFARWRGWRDVSPIARGGWRWAGGGLAFVGAIALWAVPMLVAVAASEDPAYHAYARDILFHQTADRYADSWAHQQPFWYFLEVALVNWLPLSLTYPGTFPRWWKRLRARDARFLLPLAWVVMVFAFFSFPAGKRDVYVLIALPWVALVTAPMIGELLATRWFTRAAFALIVLVGAGILAAGLWALTSHPPIAQDLVERRGLPGSGEALWWLLIAIGGVMLGCAALLRPRRGVPALLAGIFATTMLWSLVAYPMLNDSSSSAGLMRRTGAIIGPDAELGLVAWREQNLLMADRAAVDFGFSRPWPEQLGAAILWQEAVPERRWVFILADAMGPCIDKARAIDVGHANRREWWLFRADAVVAGCRDGQVPVEAAERGDDANVP
ncbi:MAG TPA: glycosyltransferase family 39 protein [Rhodanobacteraceae bacterium]|nr:glycosyltransferase family 39 protein [Rhodanobacteraceae bacterium]